MSTAVLFLTHVFDPETTAAFEKPRTEAAGFGDVWVLHDQAGRLRGGRPAAVRTLTPVEDPLTPVPLTEVQERLLCDALGCDPQARHRRRRPA
ncbi:hypothetical protein ABZ924_30435 [Streptomyces sp. NPDC046876]|uniref:hypothetical protein n=1 Tax=Streptomyces sp. NPDC046876 TaxID=3155616 RepID=UPI0034021392